MRGVPAVASIFALAIFLVDAFVNIHVAIAVLYVGVVLMSLSFCESYGVLAIAAGCMALTTLALVIQHGFEPNDEAIARFLVSLAAISITTVLAVRIASTTTALRNQAQLLDLTLDAIFVRDMNDIITYWNRGAELLYGWPAEEALGSNSHQLTRTTLPAPYDDIKAQLLSTGHWEGELVHVKRDGSRVTVASRWALQFDDRGHPTSILESNTNIEERKQAQEKLAHAQAELAHFARISTLGELTA
ncbi:MAG: PAS domain-containing protein [Xanthobacteraceae bacterium]